jgi:hypothetical protein
MSRPKIKDELTKWQRYRLKDMEAYRSKKREYAKSPEQRKKRAEYQAIWRAKNREKHNQQARESHNRNKAKHINRNRNYHLLKKYGITLEQKIEMIEIQEGKCKICNTEFSCTRATHVDHCHATGKIRGILCHVCNTKLAWYERHKEEIVNYLGN